MRLITILALMTAFLAGFCQPALPQAKKPGDPYLLKVTPPLPPKNDVTVIRGLKHLDGWTMDNGKILIENDHGKVIMDGWVNRTGAVELYSLTGEESYVGQLNPMGHGLLMDPKTGDTVRIEVNR